MENDGFVRTLVKNRLQLISTLAAFFCTISDGMHFGWTAPAIPLLSAENSPITIPKDKEIWLEHIYLIGGFSGIPLAIIYNTRIGRRKLIMCASVISLISWITIASVREFKYLLIARFLCGFSINMSYSAMPAYISETADPKVRGFLSGFQQQGLLVGVLLIYVLSPYLPLYGAPIVGASFLTAELSILYFMPESPVFLLTSGKQELAKVSLNRFRPHQQNDVELEDLTAAVERQARDRGNFKVMFSSTGRKSLFIVVVLTAAQQLACETVITMNLHTILTEAGSIYMTSTLEAIIFSVVMLMSGTISCFVSDRFGRRPLLLSSAVLTAISFLVLGGYLTYKKCFAVSKHVEWLPLIAVMFYAAVFKFGLGLVPVTLASELFPTKIKMMAISFIMGCYFFFGFVYVEVYQRVTANYGLDVFFYISAVLTAACCVIGGYIMPETKGKTLEEIQLLLKNRKKNNLSNGK